MPGTVTGNAATNGLLDALNAYLATFPSITINDITITESIGNAIITVSLSAASTNTVTVNFSTSNGTALTTSDYSAISGVVTFSPGQTTQSISIQINNDNIVELTENINVTLSDPTFASILVGEAIVNITDNDVNLPSMANVGCDPQSLYDVLGSAYHQSVAQKSDGSWSCWGALMANDGATEIVSPQEINVSNYPTLTGTPLKAATASAGSGSSEQTVVLTTTGLLDRKSVV